jgi:hypothetical protein
MAGGRGPELQEDEEAPAAVVGAAGVHVSPHGRPRRAVGAGRLAMSMHAVGAGLSSSIDR